MDKFGENFDSLKPEKKSESSNPGIRDSIADNSVTQVLERENKKSSYGLYEINEYEGIFEVVLPGAFNEEWEAVAGFVKESFESREEAEQAIEEAKKWIEEETEKASLKKTFEPFYRIDELSDGKFRVVTPGLVDLETGNYFGTTNKDFDSWQGAKDYFLKRKESAEKVAYKPLLEIEINNNEKIAFSSLDNFNPQVAPAEKSQEIPTSIKKYLLDKEKMVGSDPSAHTYQNTLKEKNWERNLFSFIASYIEESGDKIAKDIKVEGLRSLAPKQAIELSTQMVIDLTKYKFSDVYDSDGHTIKGTEMTDSDRSTALQILKEGYLKNNDPDWEGNGVCRNFASAVKAVFESLKASQTRFSQLRDTYCLFERGVEGFDFQREDKNVTRTDRPAHVWNTFVTVLGQGTANAVITDVTWAKHNLDTKKIEGLDHTLDRMEPIVNAVGQELQKDMPNKERQLENILSFYCLKIERLQGKNTSARQEEAKNFFVMRALELINKQGIPEKLPENFIEAINAEYPKIASGVDRLEIETIYRMMQKNSNLDFNSILRGYLKDRQLSDYHAGDLIFVDDKLQAMVFDELKQRNGFYEFLKDSPKFRVRMRKAVPQLFLGFSPATNPEDAKELKYLSDSQRGLSRYSYIIDTRNPSEDSINKFFDKVRDNLQKINAQKYKQTVANLDDYYIISRFDKIERELRS